MQDKRGDLQRGCRARCQGQVARGHAQHDEERTDKHNDGEEQVLRAMMRHFCDIEQIIGDTAHKLTGLIVIIELERHLLQMIEQVPAHVIFHAHAHDVAPVVDEKLRAGPKRVQDGQDRDDGKEHPELAIRQRYIQNMANGAGEDQVNGRDERRAEHIEREQFPMRLIVRYKTFHDAFFQAD